MDAKGVEPKSGWTVVTETRVKSGGMVDDGSGNLVPSTGALMEQTERLQVPGGWLFRSLIDGEGETGAWVVAMAFVPEVGR